MKAVVKRYGSALLTVFTIMSFLCSPLWAAKDVKFVVFSDPHLYDSRLGTEGGAFEEYLIEDRKMLRESEAILDATIAEILDIRGIQFVLVPGDMTKDGEKKNHRLVVKKLAELEKAGIKVFVVPGNHDVNNPHAFRYDGDEEIPVPYVSPRKFKITYKNFGFEEALYQDPHSLSYVAEPVQGLWLIAMDSCIYDNNLAEGRPRTSGEFKPETLQWIMDMVAEGHKRGKRVIGMMHHGVVEHYTGQSILFPDYVVNDWPFVAQEFAAAGLNMVFTGHYHANDVTRMAFGENFIIDVETGSLLTYPSPFRVVTLSRDNFMEIESRFINEIDYDTGDLTFPAYAEAYLIEGLTGIAYYSLQTDFGLPPGEPTATYAGHLAEAFVAHYAGDETPSSETLWLIFSYLSSDSPIEKTIGQYLFTLWSDLPPADASQGVLTIDLDTGVPVD